MTKLKQSRPPGPAVVVRALRKSFGDHLVLDGIDRLPGLAADRPARPRAAR